MAQATNIVTRRDGAGAPAPERKQGQGRALEQAMAADEDGAESNPAKVLSGKSVKRCA
jgi:hypothetical protein